MGRQPATRASWAGSQPSESPAGPHRPDGPAGGRRGRRGGAAGSTLNACPVKVEKRKLSYKDGNGMFTLPEVVQDSWRRGQGMTWETPFPLPSSKRHKATVEKAQQAAQAESVADSTE